MFMYLVFSGLMERPQLWLISHLLDASLRILWLRFHVFQCSWSRAVLLILPCSSRVLLSLVLLSLVLWQCLPGSSPFLSPCWGALRTDRSGIAKPGLGTKGTGPCYEHAGSTASHPPWHTHPAGPKERGLAEGRCDCMQA